MNMFTEIMEWALAVVGVLVGLAVLAASVGFVAGTLFVVARAAFFLVA
jgi:hypothetical protein